MSSQKMMFAPSINGKIIFNGFKRAYNGYEFANSNSGFSRPFYQGVEIAPSLSYDLGVFLCPFYCGARKLGGLLSCRSLGSGLLTRLSVASMFLAGQEVTPKIPRRTLMDNCIQNLPYPVNTHQKQILNKLLGRKRFNRDVLLELKKHQFITEIKARAVNVGWVVDLLTIDQQVSTLKTLDGSKDKIFKSLDTVNEFLIELGCFGFVVTFENKEVTHG
ncbi:hypothetical protein J3998_05965 [Thiomicrorhabdus sp. 6S2-11]|uniref:Uncharacterized protein n=1 Tax=Thiomicrorhabdus marina TaxID=2818442 RepID=A0ABS3Q462_9GAMM|nr:hypothetical protein [Thiomicrorhabdus marina]MBO1927117.1 hypothetical protein [Thiomicrorhabdus marina]